MAAVIFFKVLMLKALSVLFTVVEARAAPRKAEFQRLWTGVWKERQWHQDIDRHARYGPYSVDLLARFLGVIPAGTLRMVAQNDGAGLPTLNGAALYEGVQLGEDTFEVTLLAVRRSFRCRLFGSIVLLKLARHVLRWAQAQRYLCCIGEVDEAVREMLDRRFAVPFEQIGPKRYSVEFGSPDHPVAVTLSEVESHLRRINRPVSLYLFPPGPAGDGRGTRHV